MCHEALTKVYTDLDSDNVWPLVITNTSSYTNDSNDMNSYKTFDANKMTWGRNKKKEVWCWDNKS